MNKLKKAKKEKVASRVKRAALTAAPRIILKTDLGKEKAKVEKEKAVAPLSLEF